jgi:hypothetical protein
MTERAVDHSLSVRTEQGIHWGCSVLCFFGVGMVLSRPSDTKMPATATAHTAREILRRVLAGRTAAVDCVNNVRAMIMIIRHTSIRFPKSSFPHRLRGLGCLSGFLVGHDIKSAVRGALSIRSTIFNTLCSRASYAAYVYLSHSYNMSTSRSNIWERSQPLNLTAVVAH